MSDEISTVSTSSGPERERGTTVSYGDVEGACFALLKDGERPSVALVRGKLGRGSAATIADALKRFWKTFGARCEGDPVALSRLPSDIVELTDGLWQRALNLASQSAAHDNNAARERLERVQAENELRRTAWAVRERDYDTAAREREQVLSETRQHLKTVMQLLERQRLEAQAKDRRIAELESQLTDLRQHLTTLMARAVRRHQAAPRRPKSSAATPPAARRGSPSTQAKPVRRASPKARKSTQRPKHTTRSRRRP